MLKISELVKRNPLYGWLLFLLTMGVTFLLGLFASTVMERRAESYTRFQTNTPLSEFEVDPEKWKSNFPQEYEGWRQTQDSSFKSKFGGSAVRDLLAEHPNMVVMWAGYAFSREYNQSRGHFNAVADVRSSLRTNVPQPGTCWTCKSPEVPKLMNEMGIGNFYKATWNEIGSKVKHPIACLDCHDPKTIDLRVPRPALIESFTRRGKDIKQASHQEMRTLACAQCHVEYYFKDKTTFYLTFPHDKGFTVENIEQYYDEINFYDWVHPLSKAHMLKAQHPDWELAQQGIHAQRGVGCADCHMPYKSVGGVKITDHKIQSPLNNVNNSCQVCHPLNYEELVKNVYDRQEKIEELRKEAQKIITQAHIEAKTAWDKGATEAEMAQALVHIRHAQWRWDFAVASIGGSFHAPLECARILGTAIQLGQEARLSIAKVLAKHGVTEPIVLPDLSSKEKAQAFIGLNMKKLEEEKKQAIETNISKWETYK